jgi:hypothetical protein
MREMRSKRKVKAKTKRLLRAKQAKITEQAPRVLSMAAGVNGQRYVCIIVMVDISPMTMKGSKAPEPLVAVLASFETRKEADTYAKFVASKQYPRLSIDVVDQGQWLFPETVDTDSLNSVYGDENLNSIMKRRRVTNKEVEEHEKKLTAEQLAETELIF